MADEKNEPRSVDGGVFYGSATAGRDLAGRDINNYSGPTAEQLKTLLAPLQALARSHAAVAPEAAEIAKKIETEAAKGKAADDSILAKLIDGFVALIPAGAGAIVAAFASPLLGAVAGPVTKFVLDKLKT